MQLDLLPARTASAAAQMATDFLLLQRYPAPTHARFRTYDWSAPACTFGYSQPHAWARAQAAALPGEPPTALIRRPSGGGLVDHRHDWTYTLVLPRSHPLGDAPATQGYHALHTALAAALAELGQPASLQTTCACLEIDADTSPAHAHERPGPSAGAPKPPAQRPAALTAAPAATHAAHAPADYPGLEATASADPAASSPTRRRTTTARTRAPQPSVCFQRAELYDLIHPATGAKLAGAALKRTRHGLLFQGSLARAACLPTIAWPLLAELFPAHLAAQFDLDPQPAPWPDDPAEELPHLTELYDSPEWNEQR